MPGPPRSPSRQRPKTSQRRRPERKAEATHPVATEDVPQQKAVNRAPLILGVALVGALVVAWVGLLVLAPGMLPSLLRPSETPDAAPTPISSPSQVGGSTGVHSEGRISFVRTTEGGARRDLYLINADGSGQQEISDGLIVEGTTQWSPDGRRIVLQAGVNGVSNIVVIEPGTGTSPGKPLSLTSDTGKDSAFPAWSPDGARIAFQSKMEGDLFQVYVMDADGNNKRRLSDGRGFAGLPAWSPDGTSVAYVSGEQQTTGSQRELYVVPVTGGEPRKLTSLRSPLSSPQWSPDGSSIVVLQAVADRQYNLLLVNPESGDHRILVQGGVVRDPRFSPSGDAIVYYNVTPDEGSNVYVVRVSDGSVKNLTAGAGDDYQAVWSPGGDSLAWSSNPGSGQYRIVVANPDGSGQRIISTGDGDDYQPAWGAQP